jgi:hypothetical protein
VRDCLRDEERPTAGEERPTAGEERPTERLRAQASLGFFLDGPFTIEWIDGPHTSQPNKFYVLYRGANKWYHIA